MKKTHRTRRRASNIVKDRINFTRTNLYLMAAAVITIILGYLLLGMGEPGQDSFVNATLAPFLLVLGYAVLVPWALLAKPKKEEQHSVDAS